MAAVFSIWPSATIPKNRRFTRDRSTRRRCDGCSRPSRAAGIAGSYLLHFSGRSLVAQRYDADRASVTGRGDHDCRRDRVRQSAAVGRIFRGLRFSAGLSQRESRQPPGLVRSCRYPGRDVSHGSGLSASVSLAGRSDPRNRKDRSRPRSVTRSGFSTSPAGSPRDSSRIPGVRTIQCGRLMEGTSRSRRTVSGGSTCSGFPPTAQAETRCC